MYIDDHMAKLTRVSILKEAFARDAMPENDDPVDDTLDEDDGEGKFSALAFPYEKFQSRVAISKAFEQQRRLGQAEHPTKKKKRD